MRQRSDLTVPILERSMSSSNSGKQHNGAASGKNHSQNPTKLHYGKDLLERLESRAHLGSELAVVPTIERNVFLEYRSCSEMELGQHSGMIRMSHMKNDRWYTFMDQPKNWYGLQPSPPPERMQTPAAVLTPALNPQWERAIKEANSQNAESSQDSLLYICIIKGTEGTTIRKIIHRCGREDMAVAMFHELLEGYSVAYVGAMFASEYERLVGEYRDHQTTSPLRRCQNLDELRTVRKLGEQNTPGTSDSAKKPVGIIC